MPQVMDANTSQTGLFYLALAAFQPGFMLPHRALQLQRKRPALQLKSESVDL